jgi:hypothetical protein
MFCFRTFNTPGVFPYRCLPHSFAIGGGFTGMTGAVTVANSVARRPIIAITRPTNGQILMAPSFTIETGNVIDPDGSVVSVEFFRSNGTGPVSIGMDTSAPFTATVTNLTSGGYTLTARATDNTGLISTSAPVVIVVQTPQIQLTAPGLTEGGLFRFNFNTISGTTYRIEGSTTTDSVVPMAEIGSLTATSSVSTFTDPESRSYRMYRVRLEP